MCSLLSRVILFIISLSSPECRNLLSSHLHSISKETLGEEFQLHVATPTYATHPMSLYKTRDKLIMVIFPCWCTTGPFSTGMQQGLLSLLVCKSVFFPFWCLSGSSFPAGASQISYLPWQPKNKRAMMAL